MGRRLLLPIATTAILLFPTLAGAHAERPTDSPARPGSVPDPGRTPTAVLDVCKTGECAYEHIQAAVAVAVDGALIRIWPGFYPEDPSRAAPELPPDLDGKYHSYGFHLANPNSENLIAVVGKKNVTLRGMGDGPLDVVIDVEFKKHVGIRGDRADGLIIENLSVWHAFDHGVYVLETDGFMIDRVHSFYSRDYAFLTFANDHGLMSNCEAVGAGDAGLYPGGAADTPGRFSMEIFNCASHRNVIGYSGTQGNYVWMHQSELYDNAVGLTSDSETDHPNYPQKGLLLENNRIYRNNFDVYAGDSDVAPTVGIGEIVIPVGVGVFLASGNDNVVGENQVWGHNRYGVWLASGQALVIGPTSDPPAEPFVSTGNRFLANRMYAPGGGGKNRLDFAWDGVGTNNCWQGNTRSPDGEPATSDGALLPPCNDPVAGEPMPVTASAPNPANAVAQAGIAHSSLLLGPVGLGDAVENKPMCVHLGFQPPDCVWGPGPTPRSRARNLPQGYQRPPEPEACGPSTCGAP